VREDPRHELAIVADRMRRLYALAAGLAAALTIEQVAEVLVEAGAGAIGATLAAVWGFDGRRAALLAHSEPRTHADRYAVISIDVASPISTVLQERRAIWIEDRAQYAAAFPITEAFTRPLGLQGFAYLPLETHGTVLGAVGFAFATPRVLDAGERELLQLMVSQAAIAFERARLQLAEASARRLAEAASLRKDELLAMLGHELRNPLAAMVSAMELVKAREPALSRELAVLDRQLAHLTHMIGELVDVSRITHGKVRLRRTAVELAEAVEHAIDVARPVIAQRQHALIVEIAENLLVDADRDRLIQVIGNLVTNAATYTPAGGRIEVTAAAEDAYARITVRDDGIGIPPPLLPSVFDMFVQGERDADRNEGGLGVGLTIVRTLVELHGGTVDARSDGPGRGSSFTVRWPRASARSVGSTVGLRRSADTKPLRVLIVDDNVDAAEMFGELLRSMGHEPIVVHDGTAALKTVEAASAHVAFLDIGLPVIDGYELAERLRALPHLKSTLLVAITGYGQAEDRERARQAGFAHHLVKPVELATLTALLPIDDEGEPEIR
jgi:signal transduction histidine kinase/CheY-like chemotaxis protein